MTEQNKAPPAPETMRIWETLKETNPNYTKQFDRGGYKGTSINPTYCYQKMTQAFGPCGIGWKYEVVDTKTHPGPDGKEMLLFMQVNLYVKVDKEWSAPIVGFGGDSIIASYKKGDYLKADDEAYKKAMTDALTNAMKMLGMSADIHTGLFDDNKYINGLKEKYKDEKPKEPEETPVQKATRAAAMLEERIPKCETVAQLDEQMKKNEKALAGIKQNLPERYDDLMQKIVKRKTDLTQAEDSAKSQKLDTAAKAVEGAK